MKGKTLFFGLVVLVVLMAPHCGKKGEVPIKGDRREEVISLADPIVDSLMESHNNGDYEQYVKDFTERLRGCHAGEVRGDAGLHP